MSNSKSQIEFLKDQLQKSNMNYAELKAENDLQQKRIIEYLELNQRLDSKVEQLYQALEDQDLELTELEEEKENLEERIRELESKKEEGLYANKQLLHIQKLELIEENIDKISLEDLERFFKEIK